MISPDPAAVDLRELANRIAGRREPTPYDQMQRELGRYFTHELACELATWTWRLRQGVPVSIEPHAYCTLIRQLIRRQRQAAGYVLSAP